MKRMEKKKILKEKIPKEKMPERIAKTKAEGGEGLEKAECRSGEQGDSGKDGNSAENGDSQDENANPGNGESDEKDDSGKADSGSSGGNADLNEDGSSSNGKTDEPKEDVKTDEKTEEEIDEKEGFWRKVKVRWVLDAEESQASRYDGENPGIYLFRAELKSSNYEVDEDELPVIQITVLEEEPGENDAGICTVGRIDHRSDSPAWKQRIRHPVPGDSHRA